MGALSLTDVLLQLNGIDITAWSVDTLMHALYVCIPLMCIFVRVLIFSVFLSLSLQQDNK